MWLRNRKQKNTDKHSQNQASRNLHSKVKSRQHMDTLIGSNTIVAGDISYTGGLHIDGQVSGNISSATDQHSLLIVGNSAKIIGDVKVERAVVNGYICGSLYVYDHLELGEHAIIMGDVHYNLIEMAIGAEVRGRLVPDIKKEPRSLLEDHSKNKTQQQPNNLNNKTNNNKIDLKSKTQAEINRDKSSVVIDAVET